MGRKYGGGYQPDVEPGEVSAPPKDLKAPALGRVCEHGQLARSCERCDFETEGAELRGAVLSLTEQLATKDSELRTWQAMHRSRGKQMERRTAEVAQLKLELARARDGMREAMGVAAEQRRAILKASGTLGAALVQVIDKDDKIIVEHIREAHTVLRAVGH